MINTLKKSTLYFSVLFLASCRLVMTVDDGGSIVSASGVYDCSDSPCSYDVPPEGMIDTFTAVPDDGYMFLGWQDVCKEDSLWPCDTNINSFFATKPNDMNLTARFEQKQSWDNGLTGLWGVEITDASLIPIVQRLLGLDDPINLVAPGGTWLIIENNGEVLTSSCDTTAVIGASFDRVGQSSDMNTDSFILNVPDGSDYDVARGLVPLMVMTAEMRVVNDNLIEFVVNAVQPIPLVIPLALTRIKNPVVQIGQSSALKGGTACSFAQGAGSEDFDLHLTTYYENDFLRLRLDGMSLAESSQSTPATLDSSAISDTVTQGAISFTDNAAPNIEFDFGFDSQVTGKVIIPEFTVN